jgi:Tetratricopeptide repeat
VANPRIDDLRRRLEREPGSRLFGQLAEELRKDGELVEAIRVARTGLAAHPNYPSARMTLGRALFDTGDLAAARGELELVLRGAPENILASRMLAECLEGLGDPGAALLQFRAALRLAPGDRQTEQQIRALEQRLAGAGSSRPVPPPAPHAPPAPPALSAPGAHVAATPPAAPPRSPQAPPPVVVPPAVAGPPPAPPAPPPPPRFTASVPPLPPPPAPAPPRPAAVPEPAPDFDDVFETAPSWQRAPAVAAVPEHEAMLLLEDAAPTLPGSALPVSRPADAVAPPPEPPRPPQPPQPVVAPPVQPPRPPQPAPTAVRPDTLAFGAPPPLPPQAPLTLAFEPTPAIGPAFSFELPPRDPEPSADTLAGAPAFAVPPEPAPVPGPPLPTPPVLPAAAEERETALPVPAVVEVHAEAPALSTSTLAELYFDQGFSDKAIQVYVELLEREPQNERARARLIEIKAVSRHVAEVAVPDSRAERRLLLQRKIARLEQMLAAVRRG